MDLQDREPIFFSCRFPLDATLEFFQQWIVLFHQEKRCFGLIEDLPYDLIFLGEFQEEGRQILAFGNKLSVDILELTAKTGEPVQITATPSHDQVEDPIGGYVVSILPLSTARIELTVTTYGPAFNHCLRRLLYHINVNWPLIERFPCELLYDMSEDPEPVVNEEITTVAAFIGLESPDKETGNWRDVSHKAPLTTGQVESTPNRSEHLLLVSQPGRQPLRKSDPDDYYYRLCMAQRAVELREQNTDMTWKEIAKEIQWPDRSDRGLKKLERARKELKDATHSDISQIEHRRQRFAGKCSDGQK